MPDKEEKGEAVTEATSTPETPASETVPASKEASPSEDTKPSDPPAESAFEGLDATFDFDDEIEISAGSKPEVETKEGAKESPPVEDPAIPGETETKPSKVETKEVEPKPQGSKDTTEAPKVEDPKAEEPKVEESKKASDEPASVPSEPVDLVSQLEARRVEVIDALASERFALSKEEEQALEMDAVEAIPRLLANVYLEAVKATINHVNTMVPHMIDQRIHQKAAQQSTEGAFFKQFPAIDSKKFGNEVRTFADAFTASNPAISQEDLFALVGAAVMSRNNLVATAAPNGVDPISPAVPKPSKQPFVPAGQGAAVQVEPEPENPFAGLGQVFDE